MAGGVYGLREEVKGFEGLEEGVGEGACGGCV